MRIYELTSKQKLFGFNYNYSFHFTREKYQSSEFDFLESRLRRVYQRLALGNDFAGKS